MLVVGTDPIGYGVLTPPAEQGADIVCGDIQSLGLHQWFGGAHGGFIAVHDDPRFIMEMPSRLFGLATTDVPGEYGFGDVAYDRTSFAHREEGKEWVGTAAALWGIAAGVYLALMGPQGMRDLGEVLLARTRYAQQRLAAIPGVRARRRRALHLREFTIDLSGAGLTARGVVDALRAQGIEPGVPVGEHRLLVCVTEMTSQPDIDRLAVGDRGVSSTGAAARGIRPDSDHAAAESATDPRGAERMSLPVAPKPALRRFHQAQLGRADHLRALHAGRARRARHRRRARRARRRRRRRRRPARRPSPCRRRPPCPRSGQMRVLKHYLRLSQENLGADLNVDIGQGTCTMKYAPKVNDQLVGTPGAHGHAPAAGPGRRAGRARDRLAAPSACSPRSRAWTRCRCTRRAVRPRSGRTSP